MAPDTILMDDRHPSLLRIAAYLLVPVALVVLLPLVLLFVVGYYLFVLVQSVRVLVELLLGRRSEVEPTLQRPHFLDHSRESVSDASRQTAE